MPTRSTRKRRDRDDVIVSNAMQEALLQCKMNELRRSPMSVFGVPAKFQLGCTTLEGTALRDPRLLDSLSAADHPYQEAVGLFVQLLQAFTPTTKLHAIVGATKSIASTVTHHFQQLVHAWWCVAGV